MTSMCLSAGQTCAAAGNVCTTASGCLPCGAPGGPCCQTGNACPMGGCCDGDPQQHDTYCIAVGTLCSSTDVPSICQSPQCVACGNNCEPCCQGSCQGPEMCDTSSSTCVDPTSAPCR
jgi:hypothetical protein